VRIRTVYEEEVDTLTVEEGRRCWVPLINAAGMALTGLTRKVLGRAHLLPTAPVEILTMQGVTQETA
jgi:hypothetical protein